MAEKVLQGKVNTLKDRVDTFAKKGDEAQMNSYIHELEKLLEENAAVLQTGKGPTIKAECLEVIHKSKGICVEVVSKDKVKKLVGQLNSKRNWAEGAAAKQDLATVERYIDESNKLLEENEQYLHGPEGQKLKKETHEWFDACLAKCGAAKVDADVKKLTADLNRLLNWLDAPAKISENSLNGYVNEAQALLADKNKEKLLSQNDQVKVLKEKLSKELESAKKYLADKSETTPTVAPTVEKVTSVTKDEEYQIKQQFWKVNSQLGSGSNYMSKDPYSFGALISEAEKMLQKYGKDLSNDISKLHDEMATKLHAAKEFYEKNLPIYLEKNALNNKAVAEWEEKKKQFDLLPCPVSLRNTDKIVYNLEISTDDPASGLNFLTHTNISTNTTRMNLCHFGSVLKLKETKATLKVPAGSELVVIKNGVFQIGTPQEVEYMKG